MRSSTEIRPARLPVRACASCILACLALLGPAERATAERAPVARALISPTAATPIALARGQDLDLTLLSATGLTPPPGLQEARAHRGLHVALCSDGLGAGAASRACTPLRVDDVRPHDAHSLAYRVRAHVESWLGEGVYDLYVRFPGGEESVPGGVRIGGVQAAELRVHAGPRGLGAVPADARISPLPASEGGFAPGFVLAGPRATEPSAAEAGAGREPLALALTFGPAETMQEVRVQVGGAPAGSAVFVRSAGGDSAQGDDVRLPAGTAGSLRVEALAVAPDGRMGLARASARVEPQLAFGCSTAQARGPRTGAGGSTALSLLALLVSATLGRRASKSAAHLGLPKLAHAGDGRE